MLVRVWKFTSSIYVNKTVKQGLVNMEKPCVIFLNKAKWSSPQACKLCEEISNFSKLYVPEGHWWPNLPSWISKKNLE